MDNEVTFAEQQRDSVLKVHLRMRYSQQTDSDYYELDEEDPNTLVASAPEDSATFRNANRNHTSTRHKFKFSNIFGPTTSQIDFFQLVATPMLEECLNMESNCLLFTYGVTNSGKTYTVQGPAQDAGLIPRSLDLIFNTLGNKIKPKSMVYPALYNDVHKMTDKLQQQKETVKQKILYPPNMSQSANITGVSDGHNTTRATQGSLLSEFDEASYHITDNDTRIVIPDNEDIEYSVWISFVELYNESLFDLLEPPSQDPNMKKKKRPALRVGEDHSMSVYVKGAIQLEVTNTAEAYRAMAYGNRNKKMAATAMNQQSSRSHSIFKITVIATDNQTQQSRSTQMSFVDLAGSERYGKTNTGGQQLKEAGNINTSLLTLGKCINSLRHNQNLRPGQQGHIVPFRESKLTLLFKTFLSGEGMLAMVVCVNPSPQCYDETLHALKFSAIASEVVVNVKAAAVEKIADGETMTFTQLELDTIEHHMRVRCNRTVEEKFKKMEERHQESLEDVRGIAQRYHDGIVDEMNKYYDREMEELKVKVRSARAALAEARLLQCDCEAKKAKRQSESLHINQQLERKTSELSELNKKVQLQETQLSHVGLELRTTRSLYKASLDEKEKENAHLTKLLAEKEAEVQMYFGSNEELTKSSTFFEKELNAMKETLATRVEAHEEKLRERDTQINQLKKELADIDQLEKKLTLENQELKKVQVQASSTEIQEQTQHLEQALKLAQDLLAEQRAHCTELEQAAVTEGKKNSELTEQVAGLQGEHTELLRLVEESKRVTTQLENKMRESTLQVKEGEAKLLEMVEQCTALKEKNRELEEELSDFVRNKSLQFDALITNKEREVDTLSERTQQYESELTALRKRVTELEELATVQKHHMDTIQSEKENLVTEVQQHTENMKRGENRASIVEQLHLKNKELREECATLRRENERLAVKPEAPAVPEVERLRLEAELARQELQRVQIELAAAKRNDQSRQLQIQLDAKEIELENWYAEKEKAVKVISTKKEKEIAALQARIDQLETQGTPGTSNANEEEMSAALETAHQNLSDLKADSMKKLEELADIVVQRENEKDYVQNQFDDYRAQVNEVVTEKEALFATLKKQLDSTRKENEELKSVNRALQEDQPAGNSCPEDAEEDKENEELQIQQADCSVLDPSPHPLRRVKTLMCPGTRRSKRIASMSSSYCEDGLDRKQTRTSSRKGPRKSLGKRRTSQVLISGKNTQLKSTRSRTSRVTAKISEADEFMTPEPVGVKRKATFKKGLKNLMSSGSKKGKPDLENLSESDSGSDFITPARAAPTTRAATGPGKRKLCKTQITSPLELLPVPAAMKVQDIDQESKMTRSSTRSRGAKLIKQHLSGTANTRKTRSRVAKNSSES